MVTVKLTTPWNHDFYNQTPEGKGIYGNYKFEIDNECSECDYWIIWGDLKVKTRAYCRPDCVLYLTDETHEQRSFNEDFLKQFSTIITARRDILHPHIIQTHDLGIWHFNKSYDQIIDLNPHIKERIISAISSDLTWLPGHKKRYAFVNKLIGHYKDRVEFFGRGINPLQDKFGGLSPYKYSIAIENSFLKDYFTEKIFECFLTYTLPIYYGCPNLEHYFHEKSFVRINIDNLEESIRIIDEVVEKNFYVERLPFIRESRALFLNEYHVFKRLLLIIHQLDVPNVKKRKVCIKPEREFSSGLKSMIKTFLR